MFSSQAALAGGTWFFSCRIPRRNWRDGARRNPAFYGCSCIIFSRLATGLPRALQSSTTEKHRVKESKANQTKTRIGASRASRTRYPDHSNIHAKLALYCRIRIALLTMRPNIPLAGRRTLLDFAHRTHCGHIHICQENQTVAAYRLVHNAATAGWEPTDLCNSQPANTSSLELTCELA